MILFDQSFVPLPSLISLSLPTVHYYQYSICNDYYHTVCVILNWYFFNLFMRFDWLHEWTYRLVRRNCHINSMQPNMVLSINDATWQIVVTQSSTIALLQHAMNVKWNHDLSPHPPPSPPPKKLNKWKVLFSHYRAILYLVPSKTGKMYFVLLVYFFIFISGKLYKGEVKRGKSTMTEQCRSQNML
jgi:hypothetical protein